MKEFYHKLGHNRLYTIVAALLLIGDITFGIITVSALGDYDEFRVNLMSTLDEAAANGASAQVKRIGEMPPAYIKQLFQMIKNMVYIISGLFGAWHFIVYILLINKKRFAHMYCIALSFFAALTCILSLAFASPLYLLGLMTYGFSFMGLLTLGPIPKNQER